MRSTNRAYRVCAAVAALVVVSLLAACRTPWPLYDEERCRGAVECPPSAPLDHVAVLRFVQESFPEQLPAGVEIRPLGRITTPDFAGDAWAAGTVRLLMSGDMFRVENNKTGFRLDGHIGFTWPQDGCNRCTEQSIFVDSVTRNVQPYTVEPRYASAAVDTSVPPGTKAIETITTTARRLNPAEAIGVTAQPMLVLPTNRYLVLRAIEVIYFCDLYFDSCPEVEDLDNWNALGPNEQTPATRGMIDGGARACLDIAEGRSVLGCSCWYGRERRVPIAALPFSWSHGYHDGQLEIHVCRMALDGTSMVRLGDAIYEFKPGDTWSFDYVLEPRSECNGSLEKWSINFTNEGLVGAPE